jgi:hypothetical protein
MIKNEPIVQVNGTFSKYSMEHIWFNVIFSIGSEQIEFLVQILDVDQCHISKVTQS